MKPPEHILLNTKHYIQTNTKDAMKGAEFF